MEIYESKQIGLASGATEIVSLDEAKDWAAIDIDADDDVISSIITTAREMVESFLSKDVVSKERVLFIDEPEDEDNGVSLPYNAKKESLSISSNGSLLTEGDDYNLIGISGRYIRFNGSPQNIKIEYESEPIVSPSEVSLVKSAVKALVEQVYDNRANLEGDTDLVVMDSNVKRMLNPIKHIRI